MKSCIEWADAGSDCWVEANNVLKAYNDFHNNDIWSSDTTYHFRVCVHKAYKDYVRSTASLPHNTVDLRLWFVCLARHIFTTHDFLEERMGFGTSHDDVEAMAHDPRIICLLFYFGDSMGLLTYATEWFYRAITAVEGGEMVKDALCRASQMMANVEYNVTVFAHYSQHPPVSIYYGTVYGLMED